jgi:hypothetical protein
VSIEDRSENGDFLERPIIVIGAGRSGSTLFARMLNAHPDIQFLGESDFLIARVWREVWDNRFWLNFQYYMMREPTSSREPPVEIPAAAIKAAKERASRGVRMLFAQLMQVEPGVTAWGFKEIWNGNPAVAQIPWSVYQAVFPHARWVHLVRDPFAFVQSSVRWNQLPLTIDLLTEELKHWQQVIEWSQPLKEVPDFFEIRYEDLISAPKTTLAPILASVRLDWHDNCERELKRRILASEQSLSFPVTKVLQHRDIDQIIETLPRLRDLMQMLRYETPPTVIIAKPRKIKSADSAPPYVDLRSMSQDYRLAPGKRRTLGKKLRKIAKIRRP